MDVSRPPSIDELKSAGGIWTWLCFFCSLILSGGAVDYWFNSRYATKAEMKEQNEECSKRLQDAIEIAMLKRDRDFEEKIISTIKDTLGANNGKGP